MTKILFWKWCKVLGSLLQINFKPSTRLSFQNIHSWYGNYIELQISSYDDLKPDFSKKALII